MPEKTLRMQTFKIPNKGNIDFKTAVANTFDAIKEVFQAKDILLEEVETTEDGKYWLITISYIDPQYTTLGFRKYKIAKVNAISGKIESLKVWDSK